LPLHGITASTCRSNVSSVTMRSVIGIGATAVFDGALTLGALQTWLS
jgi:hypothetical protein